VDCVVLEEPEHLTWYHVGKRWSRAFPRSVPVVGVMHTNYVDYVRRVAGDAVAGTLGRLNRFLCRQHCHKVVKLSDAVQALPRQETCFVHGVSEPFLGVGRAKAAAAAGAAPPPRFARGAYFLGKALYAKGLGELLDRFEEHKAFCAAAGAPQPEVDVFGKGEEEGQAREDAARRGLALRFQGAKDHLSPDMAEYRAFVNPSTSDVVATTSAEALAMGKWLVVPRHPCNDFLSTFPNCLVYAGDVEGDFSRALNRALAEEPAPLSADDAARLSWDAATDRFLHCCASAELGRGAALARVADKTGWVGYNAGYGMFAVVAKAMGSVRKAMAGVAGGHRAAGGGGPGEGGLRGQRTISSHALLSLQEG
jgi:digalactosyldiacylglycerol synthase